MKEISKDGIEHRILVRAIPCSSTVKTPTETSIELWAFYSVGLLPDIFSKNYNSRFIAWGSPCFIFRIYNLRYLE